MLHKSAAKSSCLSDISNKLANLAVNSNNKRHDSSRICAAARTTAFTQNEIKSWSLCSFLRAKKSRHKMGCIILIYQKMKLQSKNYEILNKQKLRKKIYIYLPLTCFLFRNSLTTIYSRMDGRCSGW